jgi:hypothetical protein
MGAGCGALWRFTTVLFWKTGFFEEAARKVGPGTDCGARRRCLAKALRPEAPRHVGRSSMAACWLWKKRLFSTSQPAPSQKDAPRAVLVEVTIGDDHIARAVAMIEKNRVTRHMDGFQRMALFPPIRVR